MLCQQVDCSRNEPAINAEDVHALDDMQCVYDSGIAHRLLDIHCQDPTISKYPLLPSRRQRELLQLYHLEVRISEFIPFYLLRITHCHVKCQVCERNLLLYSVPTTVFLCMSTEYSQLGSINTHFI